MNTTEHLLVCLAEECAEVSQRVSKALRFGLEEIQAGQEKDNAERVAQELTDLLAVAEMLTKCGAIPSFGDPADREEKAEKVRKWMGYAERTGALER